MSDEQQRQAEIRAKCFHPTGQWEEFKPEDLNQSIVSRFEQMVARYPDRLALKAGSETLTYAELNRAANQLAHVIVQRLGGGSEPVLFLMGQGKQGIVTIMGILKAHKFYVALDENHPPERLKAIIGHTQAQLLITHQCYCELAKQFVDEQNVEIINIDALPPQLPTDNLALSITAYDYAYITYTSGSTGQPKGVIDNHLNLLHAVMCTTNSFYICNEDRIGLTLSAAFSASITQILPALLNGASIFSFDISKSHIWQLLEWLETQAVTYCVITPAIFRQLVASYSAIKLPHLRVLGLGGDRVTVNDITLFQHHFEPHTILRSAFALSEVRLISRFLADHTTRLTYPVVPVGYCVHGTEVFIINDEGESVGDGEMGEILVKSRYISPGYWRDPVLTQACFRDDVNDPKIRYFYTGDIGKKLSDGCILYYGRKDFQVKIRGVRVELAEVEQALWSLGIFKEVLVIAKHNHQSEPQLLAYLVTNIPTPSITFIRNQLSRLLPASMLPSAYIFLDALPLNINKKVDIQALPSLSPYRPNLDVAYSAPRDELEEKLAVIWQEVLNISLIGIHDHFLDLGGNSLQAMQVIARIRNQFNIQISQQILLTQPTIAAMALATVQHQAKLIDSQLLESLLVEVENHE